MRIAVFGTGQLARMMALEGIAMGVEFSFLKEPSEDSRCVDHLGLVVERKEGDSVADLFSRLGCPDVVTTEKEGVDVGFYEAFAPHCEVNPPSKAVWIAQNRLREKSFLNATGVPTAAFEPAEDLSQVSAAAVKLGFPVIVKTQENGYDGKGQWWLDSEADVQKMAGDEASGPWLLEKVVPFEREVSVVAARSPNGEVAVYSIAENIHKDGILLASVVPAGGLTDTQVELVEAHIGRILVDLDYVGVLSMECFVAAGDIVANELAPRVHNSGHWTQDSLPVSQFAQHVRALLGLPLGQEALTKSAGMLNLLGVKPAVKDMLEMSGFYHWYGKEVRPGRKVGHVNFVTDGEEQLKQVLNRAHDEVYSGSIV